VKDAVLNYEDQSDPTRNPNFARFWYCRDPFFRDTPADLDRRADRELAEGRHHVAEHLSRRAAEMRELTR
jgi:hypothetical protein